jgi:hypothetical protein
MRNDLRVGACAAYKGDRRDAHRVLDGRPEGKSHLEDLVVGGRKILKCILKTWIDLAQDRDRSRALVNAVMNIWLHKMPGNFLTS